MERTELKGWEAGHGKLLARLKCHVTDMFSERGQFGSLPPPE